MKDVLYLALLLLVTLGFTSSEMNETCRTRNGHNFPPKHFNLESCKYCYIIHMSMSNSSFQTNGTQDFPNSSDLKKMFESSNDYESLMNDSKIASTFKNSNEINKWKECCVNAAKCCVTMLAKSHNESGWCPKTWDGWLCWPDTSPGTSQEKLCPIYAISSMESCSKSYAKKYCDENGDWFKYEDNEWTDYTACSGKTMMKKRLYVNLGAYAASVIAIIPALFIFQKYRSLRCHRIILHKNLFASLLLHCSSEIAFTTAYLLNEFPETSRIKKNEANCKILFVVTKYFRLTNYMWMFCEGFYLHRQIRNVFAQETSLNIFYAIGWGFPFVPITIFIILRQVFADVDCWALPADFIDWALHLPCLLSLLMNVIFLTNIVMILITKLRAPHMDEPTQFRKAVKATFFLVPLFGLHFLFTIYRQNSICSLADELYVYMGYIVDGLQGFTVAVIFCYINSEVISLIKRSWRNACEEHNLSQLHSTYNGTTTTVIHSQSIL